MSVLHREAARKQFSYSRMLTLLAALSRNAALSVGIGLTITTNDFELLQRIFAGRSRRRKREEDREGQRYEIEKKPARCAMLHHHS